MPEVLGSGRFLRLVVAGGWEWVERTNASAVVVVVAVHEGRLVLVEQHRPPVGGPVIELPAGLAGDRPDAPDEQTAGAAARELEEETGLRAERLELLTRGPASAGLTDETLTWFRATGLTRVGPGGGEPGEGITVHEVPLDRVPGWLEARRAAGVSVDPKVYAALWFARG